MRTQRHSVRSDILGRYYTDGLVSNALVNSLPISAPNTVLDLGSGNGSLSLAASRRWSNSRIITVDVDKSATALLPMSLREAGFIGRHSHLLTDALSLDLSTAFPTNGFKPDVAVCNPPFMVPKWKDTFNKILEDAGLSSCIPSIATTDAAVLFLAQNLRLLRPKGHLGIIVPDSIVSADKYANFRKELLSKYSVLRAIRLSRGSFGGTDALAHILIISNAAPNTNLVELTSLDESGVAAGILKIDADQAAKRMDYKYHLSENARCDGVLRIKDTLVDLRRGGLSSAQARQRNDFVLHTTDLNSSNYGKWVDFSKHCSNDSVGSDSLVRAEAGDIVVARVGRTLAEKIIGISSGNVVLTDCLYRLRVQCALREKVLKELCSDRGLKWLDSHAYGVAARHLTKTDLLNLPLTSL